MVFQRVFIAVWLIAGLVLAYIGWDYQAPFSYEPVGPRAFPLLMLGLMCASLVYLLVKPTPLSQEHDEQPMDAPTLRKILVCFLLLLAYALLFEALGFIVSSTLAGMAFARLYGGRWKGSAITSVLLSIGLYILFDRILDVPLPQGLLSGLEI
ncbi:putative tricarboxylic transport membrane protein [Pseudomonas duriflava]|uniref:Putative tricarboxylic transport membrane protein n=1 Tax=Pseudomonas duriflava TaxID=459528 RepID=A0A562QQ21_9PSED|nr:tripartite tricarboxylate transporter TctB family protein [Pseudomonas duriflava]TWI58773.1 putative tricarboxylic transport membrane protein [Pseudomonas duriflava]